MEMNTFIAGVLFVGIIFLFFKITNLQEDINSMKFKIKNMKSTLDKLGDQVDLPEDPINEKLRVLIKEGRDIQAVKVARENLGLSLLEGKQYVDALKLDEK